MEQQMYTTRLASACALALTLLACGESPTTAPTSGTATFSPDAASAERKAQPVPSSTVTNVPLTDHATGAAVGSFTGTVTLRHVAVEGGRIIGTLVMNGSAVVNGVT